MSSCLLIQSLAHFKLSPNLKIFDFLDNILAFYSETTLKIQLYDLHSLALTNLDYYLDKIKSELTSISISPSHWLIAFGYSDGNIQLYSVQNQKVTKIKMKQQMPIVSMCFVSDYLLIVSTKDSKLTGVRLTYNRFAVTHKEFPITTLLETANILSAPPVYQFISDTTTNPRCLSKIIEGIFIYKTLNNFAICKITDKFQVLIELSYQDCIFSFSPVYEDEVNVGVATPRTVEIYKITKQKKIELIYYYEINLKPSFISFFAPTIFLVNFEDTKCYVFTIEKVTDSNQSTAENFLDSISEIHSETIPEKGHLFDGKNMLYLFGTNGTYSISMITFYDFMDRFKKEGLFDETIEFCKKAISGNYKATMGLPLNAVRKSIKIEESITPILNQKCEEDLSNTEKSPKSVADFFIHLSNELQLKNWITNHGLKIFRSKGFQKDYFNEIINSDSEAKFFFYSKEWVSELIENIEALNTNTNINKFLISLPKKVAPVQVLIQISKKSEDIDLLVDILIHKMNDYVDAAAVIWNSGNNKKLCQLYNDYLYPSTDDINISVSLIGWLFGVKKVKNTEKDNDTENSTQPKNKYSFPHLKSLLEYNDQITIEVLLKIKKFLKEYKRPFQLAEFANAILNTMQSNPELEIQNKVMDMMDEIIIDSKIQIAKENLSIIFSRIFTNKQSSDNQSPDNREALLLIIINENISKEFNDLLLPLCDNFGFSFAKKCIYIMNKEFERAFKEVICNPNDNIFQFIKQTIRSHPTNKDQIGEAVLSISPYLIKIDVSEFYFILNNYYPELIPKVISSINNDEDALRNYYIKYLIKFRDISEMKLPKNILISFCQFLCKYYPDDMKTFLESEKNSLTDFYEICQNYKIYDACAIIADYTNDIKTFILYLTRYFTLKMITYVDSNEEESETEATAQFNSTFDFVCSKLENSISKNSSIPEIEELCKSIVECFVLPFYALQNNQKQEAKDNETDKPKLTQLQQKRKLLQIPNLKTTKRCISNMCQTNNEYDYSNSDDEEVNSLDQIQIPEKNSKNSPTGALVGSMQQSRSDILSKAQSRSSGTKKHKPITTTSSASTANPNLNNESIVKPSEYSILMHKKAEILSTDMMKICIAVTKVLSYPDLLCHIASKFENISIEYTRKTFLALINDAAYDLQTSTALSQLFHQDEQNIHYKFLTKKTKGIVCNVHSMTSCGTCGGALSGINNMIRIFPCGHAFHDNPKCLPKQICPICNPEVRIDQDVRRPTFKIQGNQAQRFIKKFELKLNKDMIDVSNNDEIGQVNFVQKKGSIKIKSMPTTLPEPTNE